MIFKRFQLYLDSNHYVDKIINVTNLHYSFHLFVICMLLGTASLSLRSDKRLLNPLPVILIESLVVLTLLSKLFLFYLYGLLLFPPGVLIPSISPIVNQYLQIILKNIHTIMDMT